MSSFWQPSLVNLPNCSCSSKKCNMSRPEWRSMSPPAFLESGGQATTSLNERRLLEIRCYQQQLLWSTGTSVLIQLSRKCPIRRNHTHLVVQSAEGFSGLETRSESINDQKYNQHIIVFAVTSIQKGHWNIPVPLHQPRDIPTPKDRQEMPSNDIPTCIQPKSVVRWRNWYSCTLKQRS